MRDVTDFAAPLLALASAACFGSALIVTQFGLRHATPLTGATVSVTFSVFAWWLLAPLLLDVHGLHLGAIALFAVVGLFYPAVVTLLTYESNRQLGPTLTGAVSCTAPLFAIAAAVVFLGEHVTLPTALGGTIIVGGLLLLAARAPFKTAPGWRLLLPLSGAALRGVAQVLTKMGLLLWASPFAVTLVSYTVSAGVMWGTEIARPRGVKLSRAAIGWFMAVGALNGAAVLLLYHALANGAVSVVSPIVATYPLFTMVFSAIFLRTETLSGRAVAGVLLAVAGVGVIVTG